MPPEPSETAALRLRVLLPTRTLLDEEAAKVRAEAIDGELCLLPRHVDFVATLVPGILTRVDGKGIERYVAVDGGVLVKQGGAVSVCSREAVAGDELAGLRERVEREFRVLDEHERTARSVLSRLEAGVLRRFADMEER